MNGMGTSSTWVAIGTLLALLLVAGALPLPAAAQDGPGGQTVRERIRERLLQRREAKAAPQTDGADVKSKLTPGDHSFTIEHDGLQRAYKVHVPRNYDPAHATPLLISLHGGGAHMEYQASDDNYGQIGKSEREGFLVVFPNGFSRAPGGKLATWNGGNCCGPARDRNVDDVGFIRQMVTNLKGQLNIDSSKVFATGMSNGGLMAQRLACEMSDVVSAIASVAGTDNTKNCSPTKPVSVLHIHAKNDDHMPFEGGMGPKSRGSAVTSFTSVPTSVSRWVERNGCSASPKRVLERPGAYCDRYAQCRGDAAVELCVTDSGTHSWPGAVKSRSSEPPSKAISANDLMWDFFVRR